MGSLLRAFIQESKPVALLDREILETRYKIYFRDSYAIIAIQRACNLVDCLHNPISGFLVAQHKERHSKGKAYVLIPKRRELRRECVGLAYLPGQCVIGEGMVLELESCRVWKGELHNDAVDENHQVYVEA